MFTAKKDKHEYNSDFLQSFMFESLVCFQENIVNKTVNVSQELKDFTLDCVTYITRDRELQINALIETELENCNDKKMHQMKADLYKQDEYYCNAIVQHRKRIFIKP